MNSNALRIINPNRLRKYLDCLFRWNIKVYHWKYRKCWNKPLPQWTFDIKWHAGTKALMADKRNRNNYDIFVASPRWNTKFVISNVAD